MSRPRIIAALSILIILVLTAVHPPIEITVIVSGILAVFWFSDTFADLDAQRRWGPPSWVNDAWAAGESLNPFEDSEKGKTPPIEQSYDADFDYGAAAAEGDRIAPLTSRPRPGHFKSGTSGR